MNQPASNADRTSMPNTMERATGRRTSDYNWITEQATVVHMSNNDPTSRWSMRRNAFTPSPEVHPTSVRYFSRDRLITAGSLFDYIQRWGTSMNIVMPPLSPARVATLADALRYRVLLWLLFSCILTTELRQGRTRSGNQRISM